MKFPISVSKNPKLYSTREGQVEGMGGKVAAILRTQLTGSVASRRWLASQPTNANAAFRLLCVCATVLCLFVQYKLSAWRCDLFVELSA